MGELCLRTGRAVHAGVAPFRVPLCSPPARDTRGRSGCAVAADGGDRCPLRGLTFGGDPRGAGRGVGGPDTGPAPRPASHRSPVYLWNPEPRGQREGAWASPSSLCLQGRARSLSDVQTAEARGAIQGPVMSKTQASGFLLGPKVRPALWPQCDCPAARGQETGDRGPGVRGPGDRGRRPGLAVRRLPGGRKAAVAPPAGRTRVDGEAALPR